MSTKEYTIDFIDANKQELAVYPNDIDECKRRMKELLNDRCTSITAREWVYNKYGKLIDTKKIYAF